MKVSVIIPTYNGAHKILNVLKSIERQTRQPDEVIVVIDGSTDETEQILSTHSFALHCLKVIWQENAGRAHVRNTGARNAGGDLLIFLDDDMRPMSHCIQQHVAFHTKYPGGILTGGLKEEVRKDSPDIIRYKSYLSEKWTVELSAREGVPLTEQQVFLSAANCSASKKIFEKLNGFDERLKDMEDYDMACRAFSLNIPLYFYYHAFAWHDDKLTFHTYIKRLREYTYAREKLVMMKPELFPNNNTRYCAPAPSRFKRLIFRSFACRWWIKMADNHILSRLLPQKLRYRIYDLIITANSTFFPYKVALD